MFGSRRAAVNDGDGAAGILLCQSPRYGRANKAGASRDEDLFGCHIFSVHDVAGCGGNVGKLLLIQGCVQAIRSRELGSKLYAVTAQASVTPQLEQNMSLTIAKSM